MTSLKTKNICFLAAFLFLSIAPTLAEVVDTVQNCNQFLRQGTPPNIPHLPQNIWTTIQNQNRYKVICQTFNGVQRFLTVYDTVNKIPVFSAYKYRGSVPGRCSVTWMTEPQLDEDRTQNNINMAVAGNKNYRNQAKNVNYDKNNPDHDKGHLFPANQASNYEEQISTMTLTNAVPQEKHFNEQRWKQAEQIMKTSMDGFITNRFRCFVVVGAHPGNNSLNGVNIPSMMWSAFHCSDPTGGNVQSGAYWGDNDDQSVVQDGTLQALQAAHRIVAFP